MTDEIKLPEPAAWREDDGHWLYYDETNSPSTFKHISEHQKDAHEKSVFALFTADQVRAAVLEERERAARACEALKQPNTEDTVYYNDAVMDCVSAIRSGHSITETQRAEE